MACIKWSQLIITCFGWNSILAGHFSQRGLSGNPKIDHLFLPTTRPHPLIPLTCGPPPMYWLGTSRWCLGPLYILHFHLNPFLSSLHAISVASMFVWFCYTFWWVFNSCSVKEICDFGLMFPTFHSSISYYPWAYGLMFLSCQRTSSSIFYSGFPWLTFYIFTSIGLCWLTFLLCQPISLLHSSGFLGPFTSSLPLLVNGLFARFFGLPQPNYHIFTCYYSSSLLAFKPIHWVY